MELPVSLPSPTSPRLAATAAAVPPLDPAVTRVERVRVPGVARENGIYGFIRTEGPFGHVGLGEHERARLLDALDLEGVLVGDVAGQGERAVGGLQSLGFEVIFHDHRHAVQGSGEAGLGKTAIQFVGLLFDVGINQDQGVDGRAILVIGGDALEILRD